MLVELFGGSLQSRFNGTLIRDFTTRFHALLAVNTAKQVVLKTTSVECNSSESSANCTAEREMTSTEASGMRVARGVDRFRDTTA